MSAKQSRNRRPGAKGANGATAAKATPKGGATAAKGTAAKAGAAGAGSEPKSRPTPKRSGPGAKRSTRAAAIRQHQLAQAPAQPKRRNPTQRPRRRAEAGGPSALAMWVEGARLRTLPLAAVPVILGTAEARAISGPDEWHWVRALACLAVALLLQIGVNYANDYSDGVRGTDDFRVGPPRLTGSGFARPQTVKTVAFVCFGLAALAGLFLVWRTEQWWLLAVGALAILAAWFYTGGKRPYGYYGLGEVFVFLFFGLVATVGTTYVQTLQMPTDAWVLAVASGLFSCAVLMANNIRDIAQDHRAGKRTLAVLLGDRISRIAFAVMALAPYVIAGMFTLTTGNAIYSFFSLLLVGPAVLIVLMGDRPKDLILALKLTSLGALAYALLLGWAIAFGSYALEGRI